MSARCSLTSSVSCTVKPRFHMWRPAELLRVTHITGPCTSGDGSLHSSMAGAKVLKLWSKLHLKVQLSISGDFEHRSSVCKLPSATLCIAPGIKYLYVVCRYVLAADRVAASAVTWGDTGHVQSVFPCSGVGLCAQDNTFTTFFLLVC